MQNYVDQFPGVFVSVNEMMRRDQSLVMQNFLVQISAQIWGETTNTSKEHT